MRTRFSRVVLPALLAVFAAGPGAQQPVVDWPTVAKIREEGLQRSRVMGRRRPRLRERDGGARPEEVGPQRTYVAVLGDALWRDRFGADPNVVGATVFLENRPYTIVGVMPRWPAGPVLGQRIRLRRPADPDWRSPADDWVVLGRTLLTAAAGASAGLLAAAWGSRFIAGFLFGVQRSDLFTSSAVILTVLPVCAAAGYLPARRLLHLEPAQVLKQE